MNNKSLAFLLLLPGLAAAAVPPQVQFDGQFASTGTLPAIEFRIVDSPSSDVAVDGWSESTAPFTANGHVSLLLGGQTPIPESVFAPPAGERYLWIKVGDDVPVRQKLVSVPFAFRAGVADSLAGGSTVQGGIVLEGTSNVLRVRGAYDQAVIEETDGPADEKKWIMKADEGNFMLLTANDADNAWADAMFVRRTGAAIDGVYFPNGKFGVGTTSPTQDIELVGSLRVTGTGINKDIELNSPIRPTVLPHGPNVPTNLDFQVRSAHMGTMQINNDNPGNVTLAVGGGRVGVGVSSPQQKLDVAGTVNATAFTRSGVPLVSSQWSSVSGGIGFTGGNVGVGVSTAAARLQIAGGDVAVTTAARGVILKAPNGTSCYRLTVSNAGTLSTAAIACP